MSLYGHQLHGGITNNGNLTIDKYKQYYSHPDIGGGDATITNNGTLKLACDGATGFSVVNKGTLNITTGATYDLDKITNDGGNIEISGGSFNNAPSAEWLRVGYIAKQQSNGTYKVTAMSDADAIALGFVARTNLGSTRYYKTVQEAIDSNQSTVNLITDVTEDCVKTTGDISLFCVNNSTFTGSLKCSGNITVQNGTVVLNDVECKSFTAKSPSWNNSTNVVIKDGNVEKVTVEKQAYNGIDVSIEGGTYSGDIVVNGDGTLVIKGGTFTTADPTQYLAEGCTYDESTGTVKSSYVAKIGEVGYDSLDAAIAAVKNGETIVLSAGEYKLNGSLTYNDKAFTIKANNNAAVSFDMSAAVALHGAKITFEGVTFNYGQSDYVGLQHTDTLVYNNCTINGKAFLYANSETFNNCEFVQTTEDYNLWTYGAKNVVFNGCTFDCNGKAVNVYIEAGNASSEAVSIEVNDVTVTSTKENKAFLNIKNTTQAYEVTLSGENTVNGLAVDSTTNSALYQVETTEITETSGKTVKVQEKADDGTLTTIFEVKVSSKAVAEIDGTKYETLAEAIAAAEAGETVKLLADVTADVTINKNITLDLGGKTLTGTVASGKATLTIAKGATANVKNGTVLGTANSYYTIQNNGTAIFEGLTATAGNTGSSMIDNWGTLTINSGTYTGGLDTVKNEPNATLDITGGTFTLEKGTSKGFTGVVFNYGKLSISGGTFIQSHKSAPYGMAQVIHTDKSGSTAPFTVITGGTFKNLCTTSAAWTVRVTNAAAGSTKVSGGTFNKKVSDSYYAEGFISTKNSDGTYSVEGPYAAKIGSKYYATLADAVKAAVDGDKIILIANVELGEQIATGKAITIDGQGKYTIKATTKLVGTTGKSGMFYRTTSAQGTLTFLNVTLDGNGVSKIFLNEGGAGETVFDGVTSTNGGGISYGSGIHISGGGSHATIKNSTLTGSTGTMELNDDNYYAANDLWVGGNVYVTVENSTIGYVFVNSAPSATETNGVVHGQLTITGENTKITYLSGEEEDATKVDKFGNNGSLVKIEAGSVDTIFDKGSYAISGGTFKTEIKSEWCADGFIPTKNEDGTYGVKKYEPVEVWTGYSGVTSNKKVASYATLAEAAENLGSYQWILISADYTLAEDFIIPKDVRVDIKSGATLTVAENVKLTVAEDCNRLAVLTGATLINNGTILVCGKSSASGKVMVQDGATFDVNSLSLPDGYILGNNGNSYYAAKAIFEITYSDGSTQKTGELTGYLTDATRATLLKDISDFSYGFSTMNKLADNFVLDLGGHTWSGKNSAIVLSTSVPMTITNGTIMYVGPTTENAGALYTSADVTIDATAVIDGGAGYAVWTDGYGHTLTVNGTVKSDGSYAITSNGSENGGLIADCDIIVNAGAKIEASNGIGIYHPELGTVTINGGTITANTGIEMCAGNLVINDGTITSTGANVDATGSQNAILDGAAVSIINRNYPGGTPTAEINGGTFNATGEGAQTIKAYDYTGDKVAEWTDVSASVNVSGGTFSSIPSNMDALCADGYKSVAKDGSYTVSKIVLTVVLNSGTENAGTLTGGGKYTAEEVANGITITAKPVGGYTFIGWFDGETKITDSATYKIPADIENDVVTYTAKFVGNVNQKLTVKSEGASFEVSYVMNGTEGTWDYWFENDEYLKGTKFVITAQDVAGTTFLYWKNGEGRILTDSKTYEFTLGEDKEFVACYTNNVPDNVKYVIFRDLDNRVIRASVSKTDTIAVPSYNNYSGYKFVGWVDADGNVLAKAGATTIDISTLSGIITIYAKYEAAKTDLTVTVDGVKQDKTYSYSDIVTVVADAEKDGNAFTAWYIGNDIVSYDRTYSFRIARDVALTAKYEGKVDKKPLVYMFMHDRVELDNGKQSIEINALWSVPDGYEFSGAGIILTQNSAYNNLESLKLENVESLGLKKYTTRRTENNGLYAYTLTLGTNSQKNAVYGVGYLTYINSTTGEVVTIYSSPITSPANS